MTEEERKAAEMTAEVFAETFMRLLRERLRMDISQTCTQGASMSQVMLNINLIDTQAPQGSNPFVCSATATIRLVADAWARPILQSP